MGRRLIARSAVLAAVFTALTALTPSPAFARLHSATSYWNVPLTADAPVHPNSQQIIDFLKADNTTNYLSLAGTSPTGEWGMPIFWARRGDKTYAVRNTCEWHMPPEFRSIRIPANAKVDPTSDSEIVIHDLGKGISYALWSTVYDVATDSWSACGGAVYYLKSKGLDGRLPESDDVRNFGHRGLAPATFAIRYGEILNGSINHVLKIAVNTTKAEAVFPMVGHENGTTAQFAPPEGTRLRLKSSVNLATMNLTRPQRIVATALQKYGVVIGDQSGGGVVLKVQNTIADGRGFLWNGLLRYDSLKMFTLDMFEVIAHGHGR